MPRTLGGEIWGWADTLPPDLNWPNWSSGAALRTIIVQSFFYTTSSWHNFCWGCSYRRLLDYMERYLTWCDRVLNMMTMMTMLECEGIPILINATSQIRHWLLYLHCPGEHLKCDTATKCAIHPTASTPSHAWKQCVHLPSPIDTHSTTRSNSVFHHTSLCWGQRSWVNIGRTIHVRNGEFAKEIRTLPERILHCAAEERLETKHCWRHNLILQRDRRLFRTRIPCKSHQTSQACDLRAHWWMHDSRHQSP